MFSFIRAARPKRTGVQTNGSGRQFVPFDEVADSELARVKPDFGTTSKPSGNNKTGGGSGTVNTNSNGKAAAASNGRLAIRKNGDSSPSEERVTEVNGKGFRQNPK